MVRHLNGVNNIDNDTLMHKVSGNEDDARALISDDLGDSYGTFEKK